jgi:hypothetical protein
VSREEIPCRSGLEALDSLHMKYSGLRYELKTTKAGEPTLKSQGRRCPYPFGLVSSWNGG